ncbi:aminotransferase class I/II-fold pyridoxal phosphate-dependent enzyme [Desulfosarcina sp. OttesenSCG-928-A07]|nr:aminotransferase class I/II-fold pyridoxal phosphate-dependent enzyme [Desulfosarcina sp. OttesenSCG-928-G17]MDL2330259.1 aminotransferase class I/II-fold pyridoxal phosphate-dependent enzyme [Desulfosarcina sp. OttesenSCG-928-A07]
MVDQGGTSKTRLIDRILASKVHGNQAIDAPSLACGKSSRASGVPDAFTRLDTHPGYQEVRLLMTAAKTMGFETPFFKTHEGLAAATTQIDGRQYLNFASYNYLGLSGHPDVNQAAVEAISRYGTSVSASRLVAGERPVQRDLEKALADLYEVDDAIVFVSGHATNVSTIGYLFGPKDLILHDSLIHNSVLEGIRLSGSTRRFFPHNNTAALDAILSDIRHQFERVLIVVEGLYSMDGDIPDLPEIIRIKQRHKALLMVDEAHSLGVIGKTGRGIREHFGVGPQDVDIWMGTLSKTLAGCGGFIAGEKALVEHLKYAAPGFVYSVGMAPPLAAASREALRILLKEPWRVETLQKRSLEFFQTIRNLGLNTGVAQGHAIVPIIVGSSVKAVKESHQLLEAGIHVQPVITPAVEEKAARLRFFLSALHTEADIALACDQVKRWIH